VNLDDLKYCDLNGSDLNRILLNDGDLLFVRTNGSRDLVGRCAVFQGNGQGKIFGFASYLIRVRVNQEKVLPRYLAYFLNSSQGRAEIDSRRRTSAGQFNINSENLRSIEFPLPELAEQARLLEQLEEREAQATQLVVELRSAKKDGATLRESILRKAFAGEL
jgi:type I restriction enzyme S subunit